MALSTILRRSASRVIGGGNRFCGNLILPSASVPSFRQFCSSPSLSSKNNESLVKDAKLSSLNESIVNDLIFQVQSLQRDIELLRNSCSEPLSTVEEDESLAEGEGMDESESVHKGIDDYSSLKGKAIESSNDEGKDSESDKRDDDSNDEGKDSESDKSNDEGKDSENDKSDDDGKDESDDDSNGKSSSDSDKSNDESLSETDDNSEYGGHESESCETLPERDDKLESGDTSPERDDKSLPKSKENEELLKEIESEILRAKTFMQHSAPDAIIPVDFPFKINNIYWSSSIVLSREYEGELIEVEVENPTVHTFQHRIDYKGKKSSPFSMDLTVVVSCMSSKLRKVELKCGARPEEISIYRAKDPADGGHNEGVHMIEFNENLKKEFGKYLEARGITLSTIKFLYGYMLDKANKERLRILENIQKTLV